MKATGIIISPPSIIPVRNFIRVFSYLITDYYLADLSLWVRFEGEQSFFPYPMYPTYVRKLFVADIPIERFKAKSAEAYIIATDLLNQRRYPFNESDYIEINPEYSSVPCGINKDDLPISLPDSDPTYLYPIVSSNGSIQFNIALTIRSKINIEIYTSIGELVYQHDLTWRNPGIANIELELYFLGSGAYFARITHSDITEVKKFIITR
jgi:hypothetical protein